jgi:hypothetical protein
MFISKMQVVVIDAEILNHVKMFTCRKFLTELRLHSQSNIHEINSSMVHVELRTVQPFPSNPFEETHLFVSACGIKAH